jgi:hypothetical protein
MYGKWLWQREKWEIFSYQLEKIGKKEIVPECSVKLETLVQW